MIEKIISGGQTGVDQAALLVATEMDIPVGGWCPSGGLDENGKSIFEKHPLKEVTGLSFTESINERTKRNIEDSDGTLVIIPAIPIPKNISDGTLLTISYAQKQQKPFLLISVYNQGATDEVSDWVNKNEIKELNIAGPRESSSQGIYDQSCCFFRECFPHLINRVQFSM